MARPIDPTSRNQVDQRAKLLRDPARGWTQALGLVIARTALKAERWDRYINSGGDPGPLVGSFPALPDTSGSVVQVGGREEDPFTTRSVLVSAPDPGPDQEAVVFYRISENATENQETREEITRKALYEAFQATADFAQLIEKRHLRQLCLAHETLSMAAWSEAIHRRALQVGVADLAPDH
ncbi:MAG: hypothetical protein ACKO5F_11060, partial [Synechococcus sp.]